jgi:phage tail sheath gpL-like
MKKICSLLIALLLVAATPMVAVSQHHGSHGGHNQAGHDVTAHEGMTTLGTKVVEGVRAVAQVKDISEAMAKMGMKETHHLMITLEDVATGKPIDKGTVALKIKGPNNTETGPIAMMGMEGGFGADIALAEKGHYELVVGSRLPDGKTRQFEFMLH